MGRPGPEAQLITKMRKAAQLKYRKRLVIVKYHGNEYSEAGVSDLLCCFDGVFVAVEVKAPYEAKTGHGVSMKQAAFMDRVAEAGGYVAVVRSVEQFLAVFDALEAVSGNPDEAG